MLINIVVIAALILSLIVNTLSLFYILKLRDTCKDMRDVENVLIECATTNAAATKDLYDSYMEIVEREDLVADGCNKLVEEYKAITENDRKLIHTLEKLARELVKEYRTVESRYSDSKVKGIEVITHLAKGHNPIACSCVFDYAVNEPGEKEILFYPDDDRYGHGGAYRSTSCGQAVLHPLFNLV